jgi:hypothetical protein
MEARSDGSEDDDVPLNQMAGKSKRSVPVEALFATPDSKKSSGDKGSAQKVVKQAKRSGPEASQAGDGLSPAKNTRAQVAKLQDMVEGLRKVVERGRQKKRGRGRSSSSSSSSSSSESRDSSSSSDTSASSEDGSSSSSSSGGWKVSRGRSRSAAKRAKKSGSSKGKRKGSARKAGKSKSKRKAKKAKDRKAGRKKGRKGTRTEFYRRVRDDKSYQLHSLMSEVRGAKMEDAKSVAELFAAWSDMAGAQGDLDSGSDSEGQDDVQRMLRDARQQLSGDFKQAVGLLPEGPAKEGQLAAAERILLSSLVQSSREQPWVAKMDVFGAVHKGMSKVRKFVEQHVYVDKKGWQRGDRGGGKGGKGQQEFDRTCYRCGQKGHIATFCPNGGAPRQWQKPATSAQQGQQQQQEVKQDKQQGKQE